jgi:UDP-N-acetylmuramate dehydrogenase
LPLIAHFSSGPKPTGFRHKKIKQQKAMHIHENYSLLPHNTFHLDVRTRWFVDYESEADLQTLLRDEYFLSQPILPIGQGSNLLFLSDYEGVIVHSGIRDIEKIKEDDSHCWLKVGAAVNWDAWVAHCVAQGWGGIENLSYIPGEVGAAAVQNIGAYGVEVAECIEEVHAYPLSGAGKEIFSREACRYAYRHSVFKEEAHRGQYFITYVVFRLAKRPAFRLDYGPLKKLLAEKEMHLSTVRDAIIRIRREKLPDPAVEGNAGSFFMNPYICRSHYDALKAHHPALPYFPAADDVVKIPAAWLIEQCGLKGAVCGGAEISNKHPLVIVNRNGAATGADILRLAETVQKQVKAKFGIDLHPEVNYIGG